MRMTRLRYWMTSLVAPVRLASACGDSSSTESTPVPTPTPISLTGQWSIDRLGQLHALTLSITQTGPAVTVAIDVLERRVGAEYP